jgi:hypothetical protein
MSDIPQAWTDLIEGLTLLATAQDNDISPLHCEHDTLHVQADASRLTRQQLDHLESLGFHEDDDLGGFYSFRFGSA